ncbi:MAG TPA: hypothetical protein VK719_02045, partial [Trebonia sp.]|nr:hypothetical protein [Trebonia sp.]
RCSILSPTPENRPAAGRYQTAYASPSCSSLGHGDVVATPQRAHRILPGRYSSSPPNWCPHHAHSVAAGASVSE